MGIHILHDEDDKLAVMYSSTTDWAFGPVFMADKKRDASEHAQAFINYTEKIYHNDPRRLFSCELEKAYDKWLVEGKPDPVEEERLRKEKEEEDADIHR